MIFIVQRPIIINIRGGSFNLGDVCASLSIVLVDCGCLRGSVHIMERKRGLLCQKYPLGSRDNSRNSAKVIFLKFIGSLDDNYKLIMLNLRISNVLLNVRKSHLIELRLL